MTRIFTYSLVLVGIVSSGCFAYAGDGYISAGNPSATFDGENNSRNSLLNVVNAHKDDMTVPVPVPAITKGADNEMAVQYLHELGNPPTSDEKDKLVQALNILATTGAGTSICKQTGATACTFEALQNQKIELTTADLKHHIPLIEKLLRKIYGGGDDNAGTPPPSLIQNRTIVCLDKNLIAHRDAAYISTFIAHELVHVGDNRNYGEDIYGNTLLREQKAVMSQILVIDELLRKNQVTIDSGSPLLFLVDIYRWKTGAAKMDLTKEWTIGTETHNAAYWINNYIKPDDNGFWALFDMVSIFYSNPPGPSGPDFNASLIQYKALLQSAKDFEKKYYAAHYVPPKPSPEPDPVPDPQPAPNPVPAPVPAPEPQPVTPPSQPVTPQPVTPQPVSPQPVIHPPHNDNSGDVVNPDVPPPPPPPDVHWD